MARAGYTTGTQGGGSTGAVTLDVDWSRIDGALKPKALAEYKRAAASAVRIAKQLAPQGKTGNLKKGIRGGAYVAKNGDYVAYIRSSVKYGLVVETGSARQAAQPHIHPARDAALQDLFASLAGILT